MFRNCYKNIAPLLKSLTEYGIERVAMQVYIGLGL